MSVPETQVGADRKQTDLERIYESLGTNDELLQNVYSRLSVIRDRLEGPRPTEAEAENIKGQGSVAQIKIRVDGQANTIASIQEIVTALESLV